jgi:hypothetical protein
MFYENPSTCSSLMEGKHLDRNNDIPYAYPVYEMGEVG